MPDDGREESREERLDRNWNDLLQELRVVQTGVQLFAGFLLTLPFTQAFGALDAGQKVLYLTLVVVAGLAVGTTLTPIAVHRLVFGDHEKERPVKIGHELVQVVIGAIAALIVGGATLVFSVVAGWLVGILAGLCLAAVLTTLLVVVPRLVASDR